MVRKMLRLLRQGAGLSTEALAHKLNVDRSLISRIESANAPLGPELMLDWITACGGKSLTSFVIAGMQGLETFYDLFNGNHAGYALSTLARELHTKRAEIQQIVKLAEGVNEMSRMSTVDWMRTYGVEVAATERFSVVGTPIITTSGLAKLETSIIKLQAAIDVLRDRKKEFDAQGEWKAATMCESVIGCLLENFQVLRSLQKDLLAVPGR
ncbi:helix-turn-helix transcriptional regulator [Alicyclobacillus pomorum]